MRLGTARLIASIALLASRGSGLDNGLGELPPMGYNTWYDFGCNLNQAELEATVRAMDDYGLIELGYKYFNLDDCWSGGRHPNGSIFAAQPQFPTGTLKPLADYAHRFGLRFGTYTCRGNLTCAGRPGSLGHERLDAQTWASWGVDLLKEDSCYADGDWQDHGTALQQYRTMRDALNETGRAIYFALCGWFPWYAPYGAPIANSWRTGLDNSNWAAVLSNIDTNANLAQYAGPGGYNDPCLLISRSASGAPLATELQSRAQFSMWAILAAPLLISGNVRNMSAFTLATYSNAEVIAVNQDSLGKQGTRLVGGPITGQAYLSDCDETDPAQWFQLGSDPSIASSFIAVADSAPPVCLMARGCQSDPIFAPCKAGGAPTCSGNTTAPHPDQELSIEPHTNQLVSGLNGTATGAGWAPLGRGGCMAPTVLPYLSLEACDAHPVRPRQQWSFVRPIGSILGKHMRSGQGSNSGGDIDGGLVVHKGSGACLTRGGLTRTNIWSRSLSNGSFALLFLNAGSTAANVTCDRSCWAKAGVVDGSTVEVRDLWQHAELPSQTTNAPLTTELEPDGGVVLFKITPRVQNQQSSDDDNLV